MSEQDPPPYLHQCRLLADVLYELLKANPKDNYRRECLRRAIRRLNELQIELVAIPPLDTPAAGE